MVRFVAIIAWLAIGLFAWIHYWGPGIDLRATDTAGRFARSAKKCVDAGQWREAVDDYDSALAALPENRDDLNRYLRLQKAKAQMMASQLPEARESLDGLLEEVLEETPHDWRMVSDTRSALASSQHYMTWLMRLEGAPKEEWEREIEAARQNYRLLAEQAQAIGDLPLAKRGKEDLEASIRLARMDLNELQGLPLPSQ